MQNTWGSYFSQLLAKLHLIFAIFACLLLISCQTMAQRQAASIRKNFADAVQNARNCRLNIYATPAYWGIAKHAPLFEDQSPRLDQLADEGVPKDEDIKTIIAVHNELEPCRVQLIKSLWTTIPGFVPILVQYYHSRELVTVDLIQRKITWGEYNKRHMALVDEYKIKAQAFDDQLVRELSASHQAELAQRQAALNALSQWSYQQQVLMQNERLINSMQGSTMRHITLVPDGNGNLT